MNKHSTIGAALLVFLFGIQSGAAESDITGLRPFTEGGQYLEKYEMGLYPDRKNEIPEAHQKAGQRIAATIKPLDIDGKADEKNGRVIALVMGHSNCQQYFTTLQGRLKEKADELHPRFEMLNAAVGGQQLPQLRQLRGPVWDKAAKMLSQPGYSPKQVQVLFLHTTYHGAVNRGNVRPGPFPETMKKMQADLGVVLEHAVKEYPNLKIAYLTTDGLRRFTGFEPHVWQESFAVRWFIESQIKQDKATVFEEKDGKTRKAPWCQWGPYIWDNTWDRSFFTDGVHPAPKARVIFVEKYWEFLKKDPVAREWMWK
jgi:hypothetical protein